MKKLLLGLGAMTAIAAPVVVAVSCGDETDNRTDAQKLADAFKQVIEHPQVSGVATATGTDAAAVREARHNARYAALAAGKNVIEIDTTNEANVEIHEWIFALPKSFGLSNATLLEKVEAAVNAAEHVTHDFTIGTYNSVAGGEDDHIEMTIYTSSSIDWNITSADHLAILEDIVEIIAAQ